MVFYHIYSEHHVFEAYVHKCRFFKDEDIVLLLGCNKELQPPRIISWKREQNIEKYKLLFDKVILCDDPPPYKGTDAEFSDALCRYYGKLFTDNGIDPHAAGTEAFTFCLSERFAYYCMEAGIPLSAFEIEAGTVSVCNELKQFSSKFLSYEYEHLNRYALYEGKNHPKLKASFCNFEAQENQADCNGYVNFNVSEALKKLTAEELQKLYDFYKIDALRSEIADSTILVTSQHLYPTADPLGFHEHDLFTHEKQSHSHNLLLDLFASNAEKVVILNGLNDRFDYADLTNRVHTIIDCSVPAELVASLPEVQTCNVIAATRQNGICFRKTAGSYVEITTRFMPNWQKFRFFGSAPVIDVYMQMLSHLGSSMKPRYFNVPEICVRLYSHYFGSAENFQWADIKKPLTNSFALVNDGNYNEFVSLPLTDVMKASENSVYLLVNQRNMYNFLDSSRNIANLLPFEITRTPLEDAKIFGELQTIRFWIYCKDNALHEKLRAFRCDKTFAHCGIRMQCQIADQKAVDDLSSVIKPLSPEAAKNVVLYGDSAYITKNLNALKSKLNINFLCLTDGSTTTQIEGVPVMPCSSLNTDAYVLIASSSYEKITELSRTLSSRHIAFHHADAWLYPKVPLAAMVAMEKWEYMDDKHNRYNIDPRLKLEDAEKITISFFQGKPRYNNTFRIGMIRIVNGLSISVKGNNNTVSIGDDTTFQQVAIEICQNAAVTIGRKCMFSYQIVLYRDDMHIIYDADSKKRINYPKNITIGDHVWVGREAMILGGASIGDHCIVGARCVTSSRFQPNTIIAGCPGKAIRENILWSRDGYEDGGSNMFDIYDRW